MQRLFVDSSVLFAAAYSRTGHARDLILMAVRGEITLVVSHLVLDETRRNLTESAPERLLILDVIVRAPIMTPQAAFQQLARPEA